MNKLETFDHHYKLIRTLSTDGGTADVWLAVDINTIDTTEWTDEDFDDEQKLIQSGMLVAIKIYRPKNALDIDGERCFREEYKIVHNCRHTNLLQPNHFSIFNELPYLELPYCKNGSSETLISRDLSEEELWKFVKDVAAGLAYLHDLTPPIIHQDIKPANILIDDHGNYAITDFGISVSRGGYGEDYTFDDEYSGTMAYMAPERFEDEHVPNIESDIWAFGVTLYEILCNNVPYGDYGGDCQLRGGEYESLPDEVPLSIRKLIDRCLAQEPGERPTAVEILDLANEQLASCNSSKKSKKSGRSSAGSSNRKGLRTVFMYIGILIALTLIIAVIVLVINNRQTEKDQNPLEDNDTTFVGKPNTTVIEKSDTSYAETTTLVVEDVPEKPKPEEIIKPKTEEPKKEIKTKESIPAQETVSRQPAQPSVSKTKTLDLGFATYTGSIVDGKPSGKGVMKFKTTYKYKGTTKEAHEGYTLKGEFGYGKIVTGQLFDENGTCVESIY